MAFHGGPAPLDPKRNFYLERKQPTQLDSTFGYKDGIMRNDLLLKATSAGNLDNTTQTDNEGNTTIMRVEDQPKLVHAKIQTAGRPHEGVLESELQGDLMRCESLLKATSAGNLDNTTQTDNEGNTTIMRVEDQPKLVHAKIQTAGRPHEGVLESELQGDLMRCESLLKATSA
eukprot:Selendium_serpulae@DN8452_c0_g1_i1.p1